MLLRRMNIFFFKCSMQIINFILIFCRLTNWKRKSKNQTALASLKNFSDLSTHHVKCKSSSVENTGPSRFDLPEIEDLTLGVFSSFDDITYNTKPIVQAPENICGTRQINNFSNNSETTAMLAFCHDENYAKQQYQESNSSDEDWIKSSESIFQCQNNLVPALKKVKFDLDEKENISKPINNCLLSSTVVCSDTIDNHAKIIREVLKKYPHLVQHNKNIRLKITQKESKNSEFSIPSKTKVSYVVLKSDSLITKIDTSNSTENLKDYLEENGPWRCSKCNLEEQYTNYYMYRRHMQDVHSERFDPRICEHCGYKATKRNILMYHMFTKHNVSPPKSMSFPKCHLCSYIALSESLLVRHQNNHKQASLKLNSHGLMSDSICCSECNQNFNDVTELASHEITSGHGTSIKNKVKGHYCFYCGKHFIKDTNLKDHIDCFHKNLNGNEYLQDMLNLMQTSSETDSVNLMSDIGIQNAFQTTQNVSEFVKMCRSKTESVSTDLNDQTKNIIVSMNKEQYQDRNVKEFPLKILKNNDIFIEDSERNIVYVQNDDNTDICQKLNYKCSQNNDEIVEEVVEELESIEDSKQQHLFNYSDLQNIEATSVALINETQENSFNLADPNTFCVGDAIQYVEEETEILEYETSTNV